MPERKTLTAQVIVKNEENFIDFAIRSVINYVDTVLVFDTGSTDRTAEKIEVLRKEYPTKIIFEEKGPCDKKRHTQLRQEMLDRTTTDWFLLLDGDEAHTKRGMEEAISVINNLTDYDWLVSPYYLCVGDVAHTYYKEKFDVFYNRIGFFTPRFVRKQAGMRWQGDYEYDTLYDNQGKMVYQKEKLYFLQNRYWHLTHLQRSPADDAVYTSGIAKSRADKRRLTYLFIGRRITEAFPEVFSGHPELLISPWRSAINFLSLAAGQPLLLWRRLRLFLKLDQ
jgi:glycosyltransferase involved in cell wall biosynthesis